MFTAEDEYIPKFKIGDTIIYKEYEIRHEVTNILHTNHASYYEFDNSSAKECKRADGEYERVNEVESSVGKYVIFNNGFAALMYPIINEMRGVDGRLYYIAAFEDGVRAVPEDSDKYAVIS